MSNDGQRGDDQPDPYRQQPDPSWQQPGYGVPSLAGPDERPWSIRTAVMLMRIGALLSLIALLLRVLTLARLQGALDESRNDSFALVALLLLVIGGVCMIGLWLWMASANGRGRSWARVVASILFGIHAVLTLVDLPEPQPVFSFSMLALGAMTMYLLWKPESTVYYDAVTAARSGR